jgi:protein-tyrosine phosphatase
MPHCASPSLFLAFHDLGDDAPADLHGGLFTDDQAKQIVEFVKGNSDTATILVNCEAGVSRSAAVAAALAKFFNGDDTLMFKKSCPNMFVFRKMLNALGIDSTSKWREPTEDFFKAKFTD